MAAEHAAIAGLDIFADDGRRVTRCHEALAGPGQRAHDPGARLVVADGDHHRVMGELRELGDGAQQRLIRSQQQLRTRSVVDISDGTDVLAAATGRQKNVGHHLTVTARTDNDDIHAEGGPMNSCAVA